MDQTPPPPPPAAPPPPPPPPGIPKSRPGVITAVAVVEFIQGGFLVLAGLLAFAGGGLVSSVDTTGAPSEAAGAVGALGGFLMVMAVVFLVLAVLLIYAGTQVLKLRERGRMISVIVAGLSLLMGLLNAVQYQQGTSFIGIGLSAFIVWACISQKDAFSKEGI